ncbi:hypothetical protein [Dyadobacter pollutisoli]|uniref:Uncharacterized protein n=1 Tax=Dyadobacter pollutisoli TaxID=2910158 RepID=A0A9E8NI38_9BACT|nr:hypothetical protein [Dyadobacter pollutisoli]WAC14697.1 hypothetical protein ON006_12190 [Dyadobacter pollutisoli]
MAGTHFLYSIYPRRIETPASLTRVREAFKLTLYPIPEDQLSPGWYYAMQFSGDLESATSSEKLF